MKKSLLSLLLFYSLHFISQLKAQCLGSVKYDTAANGNGKDTILITTRHPNELLLISYDGWTGPGYGPVNVDGNTATLVKNFHVYLYADANTYAYNATTMGTHTIICNELGYSYPYYLNSVAAFYLSSGCPLAPTWLSSATAKDSARNGGHISATITTTAANSIIYANFDANTGDTVSNPLTWTGALKLSQLHKGAGIEHSDAYTVASAPGTYTVTVDYLLDSTNIGGTALVLTAIPSSDTNLGIELLSSYKQSVTLFPNPNNGTFQVALNGETQPEKCQIEIYNLLGDRVYQATLNQSGRGKSETTISLASASMRGGLYFYRVLSETGQFVGDGKFVVQ